MYQVKLVGNFGFSVRKSYMCILYTDIDASVYTYEVLFLFVNPVTVE